MMRCLHIGTELIKGEEYGELDAQLGTRGKLRLEVVWFLKTLSAPHSWSADFLPLVCLLPPPASAPSPTSLLSFGLSVWAYHSIERQRKRRRRAGQRSSSRAEAWLLPVVNSFCRLAWSACRDGWGSGLGLPQELLPA